MTSSIPQDFKIQIKNCGHMKWPENLRFLCVEGAYERISKEISSLDVGKEDKIEINVPFLKKIGFYATSWRISNEKNQCFGSSFDLNFFVKNPNQFTEISIFFLILLIIMNNYL